MEEGVLAYTVHHQFLILRPPSFLSNCRLPCSRTDLPVLMSFMMLNQKRNRILGNMFETADLCVSINRSFVFLSWSVTVSLVKPHPVSEVSS